MLERLGVPLAEFLLLVVFGGNQTAIVFSKLGIFLLIIKVVERFDLVSQF